MSDVLSWVFELKDQMSGPAQKISTSLEGVSAALHSASAATLATRAAMGGAATSTVTAAHNIAAVTSTTAVAGKAMGSAMVSGFSQVAGGAREMAIQADDSFASMARSFYTTHKSFIATAEKMAVGGIAAIGGIGIYMGKTAVDAASFAEDTKTSLGVVLGSSEAANRVFGSTVRLAAKLPITTKEALSVVTQFSLAGWAETDLRNLTIGFSDAEATIKGGGENFLRVVNRIKAMGGVQERELNFIPAETGIQIDNIIKGLQQIGFASIKTGADLRRNINSIAGRDFVEAMLRAEALQGHGALGSLSSARSQTASGLLTTLGSRSFELLMNIDSSPGYASFRDFIKNSSDALDPDGDAGRQLKQAFEGTFNEIFGVAFAQFTGPNGAGKLEETIRLDVIPAFKEIGTVLGLILQTTTLITGGWADIARMVRLGYSGISDFVTGGPAKEQLDKLTLSQIKGYAATDEARQLFTDTQLAKAGGRAAMRAGLDFSIGKGQVDEILARPPGLPEFQRPDTAALAETLRQRQLGRALADGARAGIVEGTAGVADAAAGMGQAAIDAHKQVTQTHSPSRVFQDLGEMTAEGYALGVLSGVPRAEAAVAQLGATPTSGLGAGRGGRGPINVRLEVKVDAHGATAEDAHSIAAQIGDALPAGIVRVLDMIAGEYGQE